MRRLCHLAATVAVVALPVAVAAAGPAAVDLGDTIAADPAAGDDRTPARPGVYAVPVAGTSRALHAQGDGAFRYRGSGGTTIVLARPGTTVRVTTRARARATAARAGGGVTGRSRGATTVYSGRGTLALDGADYAVEVTGRGFSADVDGTRVNPAAGVARVEGRGSTILRGGGPVPFGGDQQIVLARAPLTADLAGPAFWRVTGPADGTVDMTISDRARVWDLSPGRDLAVAGTRPDLRRTLSDGSTLYWGLRNARVVVAGSAYRLRVKATRAHITFTAAAGAVVRAAATGEGRLTTGRGPDVASHRGTVTRILLQP